MIDLKPWKCTCGAEFVDTHAAITVEIPAHTRGTDHVVSKRTWSPYPHGNDANEEVVR